jgi:hypothetical protein
MSKIERKLIQNDAVSSEKILLDNGTTLRSLAADNVTPVDLLKLDSLDEGQLLGHFKYPASVSGLDPKEVVNVEYILAVTGVSLSGKVLNTAFSGSPKKVTITLTPALPTTNYSVAISGVDVRAWTVESQTLNNFIINANANLGLTGDVRWQLQLN